MTTYSAASSPVAGGRWTHALAQFAQTVAPGQFAQFPTPSLLVADSSGSRPFVPAPGSGSDVGMFDWASNLPYDPVTRRIMAAGGRPADNAAAQKLTWYDAPSNAWNSIGNPFGTAGGHIYQSMCLSASARRFFHIPFYSNPLTWPVVHEWNLDTWTLERSMSGPARLIEGNDAQWGDAVALVWHEALGSAGSLLFFGAASGTNGKMARFDWATQQWIGVFGNFGNFVSGHNGGIYVPAAQKALCGRSDVSEQRKLVVVNADGSFYETAVCPTGIGPSSSGRGAVTQHPTRAAAVTFGRTGDWSIHTYEFASDTWVNRGSLPAPLQTQNSAATTIPELGVIVLTLGIGEPVANSMYVYRPEF